MREDCKYFQRREYPSGDVARFCAANLAPEAPWRCPAACPRYTPLPATGPGPARGPAGAAPPAVAAEPPGRPAEVVPAEAAPAEAAPADEPPELHPDAIAILGAAQQILGAVGPEIEAERRRERLEDQRRGESWWSRLRNRSPRWRP